MVSFRPLSRGFLPLPNGAIFMAYKWGAHPNQLHPLGWSIQSLLKHVTGSPSDDLQEVIHRRRQLAAEKGKDNFLKKSWLGVDSLNLTICWCENPWRFFRCKTTRIYIYIYIERERDYDIDDCKLLGNIILTTQTCDLLNDTIWDLEILDASIRLIWYIVYKVIYNCYSNTSWVLFLTIWDSW